MHTNSYTDSRQMPVNIYTLPSSGRKSLAFEDNEKFKKEADFQLTGSWNEMY